MNEGVLGVMFMCVVCMGAGNVGSRQNPRLHGVYSLVKGWILISQVNV